VVRGVGGAEKAQKDCMACAGCHALPGAVLYHAVTGVEHELSSALGRSPARGRHRRCSRVGQDRRNVLGPHNRVLVPDAAEVRSEKIKENTIKETSQTTGHALTRLAPHQKRRSMRPLCSTARWHATSDPTCGHPSPRDSSSAFGIFTCDNLPTEVVNRWE
jgi:hypothetical protein